jgi:6-phosphogluconate dehydrogenase
MKIGLIGLGKMGYSLALNMKKNNHEVIGYDAYIKKLDDISTVSSVEALVEALKPPRVVWLMVPAGDITETLITTLSGLLSKGDILIDGGNSLYKDSIRRAGLLKGQGIHYLDVGTSGGVNGALNGACLMIGGSREAYDHVEPLFNDIATKDGFAYMGDSGSGHFVKMVHNAIEYGMMQAIGEGFDLLEHSPFDIDYQAVSKVWAHGSIIEGLLMDMVQSAFEKDETLDTIIGKVDDSGEGRWALEEAINLKVSTPVIAQALFARYKSKDDHKFSEKVVAAMRNEFGGHKVYKK